MDRFKLFISQYLFSSVLFLAGLLLLIASLTSGQGGLVVLGSLVLIVASAIIFLYTKGLISNSIQRILLVALMVFSVVLVYLDYYAVDRVIKFNEQKDIVNSETIQRLKDLRAAQVAHKNAYNRFISNIDSLYDFIRFDSVPIIKAINSIPDTLTEEQALEMGLIIKMPDTLTEEEIMQRGLIVRDTSYVSVMQSLFYSEEALNQKRNSPFKPDSVILSPNSGEKFRVSAGTINVSGGVVVPVFEISDPTPFDPTDTLKVGSMSEASTAGNWKGE